MVTNYCEHIYTFLRNITHSAIITRKIIVKNGNLEIWDENGKKPKCKFA